MTSNSSEYGLSVPSQIFIGLFHLFIGIGLHELGHAMIARTNGAINLTITFEALGGVCSSNRTPRPWSDLAIVIAGPLVSFILSSFFLLLFFLLKYFMTDIMSHNLMSEDVFIFIYRFCEYGFGLNLILGIFNCLPIYPLDGGQATFNILHIIMGTEKKLRSNESTARNERVISQIVLTLSFVTAYAFLAYCAKSPNPVDVFQYMSEDLRTTILICFVLYWGYTSLRNR